MSLQLPQPSRFAFLARLVFVGVLFAMSSCSAEGPRLPVVPVKGKVTYQGKPLAEAQVYLSRVAEATPLTEDEKKLRPRGFTQSDGTFQLTSYAANDGAPPGRYVVGVLKQVDGKASDDKVYVTPGRYANAKTSGLTAIVKAPATELPVIEIKD